MAFSLDTMLTTAELGTSCTNDYVTIAGNSAQGLPLRTLDVHTGGVDRFRARSLAQPDLQKHNLVPIPLKSS